jgi:hypothetical protein
MLIFTRIILRKQFDALLSSEIVSVQKCFSYLKFTDKKIGKTFSYAQGNSEGIRFKVRYTRKGFLFLKNFPIFLTVLSMMFNVS